MGSNSVRSFMEQRPELAVASDDGYSQILTSTDTFVSCLILGNRKYLLPDLYTTDSHNTTTRTSGLGASSHIDQCEEVSSDGGSISWISCSRISLLMALNFDLVMDHLRRPCWRRGSVFSHYEVEFNVQLPK